MAKAVAMTIGAEGVEIASEYNAVNNRITQVSWVIVAGFAARCRVWDSGVLVIDRTIGGPNTGAESIPGNYRMVQVTENGETYLALPANLTYILNVESIG